MKFPKFKQTGRRWIEVEGKHKWQGAEDELLNQCEDFLAYHPDLAIIRFPDAAYRAIFGMESKLPQWVKALIARYVKGIPDWTILKDRNDGSVSALCVELKTAQGKLSQGQKHFAQIVTVHVVRDFEAFVKLIDDFKNECS